MVTMDDLREFAAGSDRGVGECQGFVGNDMCGEFGSFRYGYGSALQAAQASVLTAQYPGTPSFAYWAGKSGELRKYGHNGFGTPDEIFMASSRIQVPLNATGTVGSCSLAHYSSYPDVTFLGWSRTNGVNTMPTVDGGSNGGRKPVMADWQFYTRDDNAAVAIGCTNPLDPILMRAWFEYPPSAWIEISLYAPIHLSNAVWDHRSNAANRLRSMDAVNAELVKAGRPPLVAGWVTSPAAPPVPGGTPADLAPVLAAIAEVPGKTRAEFTVSPLK